MKKSWLFLDCERNPKLIGFTIKDVSAALSKQGIVPLLVKCYDGTKWMSERDVSENISNSKGLTHIVWIGGEGWRYYKILKETPVNKVNMWFDDPFMRMGNHTGARDAMADSVNDSLFLITIWDKYWGNLLKQAIGIKYMHMHLAANEFEYYPAKRNLSDDIVFIGSLHSPMGIEDIINSLPEIFRVFYKIAVDLIVEQDPIQSWDKIMPEVEKIMIKGDLNIFANQVILYPKAFTSLQSMIWMRSKNEARIRILKGARKVNYLSVFTETQQRLHASEMEIRGMIGEWNRNKLKIVDTSNVQQELLPQFYHYGRIHINATDPQSVESGIPYRIFQTMASGRPLLTDSKPGYRELFIEGLELEFYESTRDFTERLHDIFNCKNKLEQLGEAARKTFEKSHTWNHRIEQINKKLECNQTGLSSLEMALESMKI